MTIPILLSRGALFCAIFFLSHSLVLGQGTWSATNSAGFTGRSAATGRVIGNTVYVIGGLGSPLAILDNFETYNSMTDTWSSVTSTGTFTPRYGIYSAVVGSKIYVIGGIMGSFSPLSLDTTNLMEVFDTYTNTWSTPTTTGTLTARFGATCETVNDKIYVIGGRDEHGVDLDIVEMFDPATNTWSTPTVNGSYKARSNASSVVIDNKVYVFFGRTTTEMISDVNVFDPASNSWTTLTTTGESTPRRAAVAGLLDGKVYIVGGTQVPSGGGTYLNTVEVFDPVSNTWTTPTTGGSLTQIYAPIAAVTAGKLFIFGGEISANNRPSLVQMLSISSDVSYDKAAAAIRLYPNPVNSSLSIDNLSFGSHISIMTLLGQEILHYDISATQTKVNLSSLSRGQYIVSITSNTIITRMSIIKE